MSDRNFEVLTPKRDLKNIEAYEDAINFAIKSEEVKNVAITGIYGSGKTSIVETFKQNKQDKSEKFIHISLANFKTTNESIKKIPATETDSDDTQLVNDKTLEGKILNQLLHQIDPKMIPQTIFRVKKDSVKSISSLLGVALSILILIAVYLWKFENWKTFVPNNIIGSQFFPAWLKTIASISTLGESRIIASIVLIISLSLIFIYLIHKQLNRKLLKSFSFRGMNIQTDIEIFNESNDSFFDKYLDDVIYLFDNAGANIFIFEDIDRFNNNVIFAKLKEINTLLNNRRSTKSKKCKITFIYLLRDDMFISKERTKFFDFIIPVIPVVNASNSYEILKEMLERNNLFDSFDKYFLQNLSLYVDDMRLLKNIFNEFIVYNEKLTHNNALDINKLLAMVVYKNIFPKDFSDLQQRQGFVFRAFYNKGQIILQQQNKLTDDIRELKQKIEDSDKELLTSIDELYSLYLPSVIDGYYNFSIEGKTEGNFNSKTEFIEALRESPENVKALYPSGYGYRTESYSLVSIFDKIDSNPEFIKRKENIQNQNISTVLHKRIKELEIEKEKILNEKLSNILEREYLENLSTTNILKETDKFESIKSSHYFDLLVYLLRNGYVDEGYEDYLTYFYPNSITLADKSYLRSIIDERKLDWGFSLNNISEVFDRLQPISFSVESSLNFDIFQYLLVHSPSEKRKSALDYVFGVVKDTDNVNFLIKSFIRFDKKSRTELIKQWYINQPILFNVLLDDVSYSEEDKNDIFLEALNTLSANQILNINNKNSLNNFIEHSEKFLENIMELTQNAKDNLNKLEVKFVSIPFSNIDAELTSFLHNNCLFEINEHNIKGFLINVHGASDEETIKHKNYSLIYDLADTPLNKYIHDNINEYLEKHLTFYDGTSNDEVDAIHSLLNNEMIAINHRSAYIDSIAHRNTLIAKIDDIDLKSSLIEANKVAANETNILDYFHSKEDVLDSKLIDFINLNKSEISFNKARINNYSNAQKRSFFRATIQEVEIDNIAYRNILTSLEYRYEDGFSIESIPDEKMDILISETIIKFSKNILLDLRSTYPKHTVIFISKHLEAYLSCIAENTDLYNYEELLTVLDANHNKTLSITKNIVDLIQDPISIQLKEYNYRLLNYILYTKFMSDDLEYLGSEFNEYSQSTKDILIRIFSENIHIVLDKKININLALLNELLLNEEIDLEKRQKLLSESIHNIEITQLKETFESLSLDQYVDVINNYRRKVAFKKDGINSTIIPYLREINLISSYDEENDLYIVNSNAKIDQI